VPDELEDRVVAAMLASWRDRVGGIEGGEVVELDGLVLALSNLPAVDQSVTLVERDPADPVAALTAAEERFRSRGLPLGVKVVVGRFPAIESAVRALGLERVVTEPVMAVRVEDVAHEPAPGGVSIRRVTTAYDRAAAVTVEMAVFGTERAVAEALVPAAIADEPKMRSYVATEGGAAIAAAHVRRDGRTVGVFGVGTVESARGRGIGAAITSFAVQDHLDLADLAWLESSDLGRSVYERLGFRPIGRSEVWVRPAPDRRGKA
jgi:GNAT superfamily N-acetyltransferase